MRSFILALAMISQAGWATGQPRIEVLFQGQPAPFDGLLINQAQEREFRLINEQLILYKDLSELQDLQLKNYSAQIHQLTKMNDNSIWRSILMFSLGALITGGLAIGVSKAIK
jgi:hypothetical protein